jgi:hypothetical protein
LDHQQHCFDAAAILQAGHNAIAQTGADQGCALPATTPAENLQAFIQTARTFGEYR